MGDVDEEEAEHVQGKDYMEIFVPSPRFYCATRTALKTKRIPQSLRRMCANKYIIKVLEGKH